MEEKSRRKWSTLKKVDDEIHVDGRVVVERTIVSLSEYRLERLGYDTESAQYRVSVVVTIGNADEGAVAKAFSALGEKVAGDTLSNGDELAA